MKQKRFVHFFLLLIIAIVVFSSIWFLVYKSGKIIIPSYDNPRPNPSTSPASLGEISNWKTYNNSYLGYSIKYPQSWDIRGSLEESGQRSDPRTSPYSYLFNNTNDQEIALKEELKVYDTFEKNAEEWYRYYYSSTSELGNAKAETLKEEAFPIGGKTGKKYTISYQYGDMKKPGTTIWIYAPLNSDNLLSIEYYSEKSDPKDLALYDQILSTLKFAENTGMPQVTTPLKHTKVKNPVIVKGKVPPGWMFEGVFPIKIMEYESGVLVQGLASEIVPGSWQSGKYVEFEAFLELPERAIGRGIIVLENDNPSGLPENAKSFQIPVMF